MKQSRRLLLVPAMLVLVIGAAAASAVADHGSSSSDSGDVSSSSSSQTVDQTDVNSSASDTSSNESAQSSVSDQSSAGATEQETEDSFHHRADSMINDMLSKDHNRQNGEARTRKCHAAEHGLETKLSNLQKNSARYQALIDKIYSQALAYQQANNLNPTNFTDLVNTANANQAAAALSVGALNNLSVNLDCGSSSVANNVATFKVAAQQARSDLLAYRKAVSAVLQALESAK